MANRILQFPVMVEYKEGIDLHGYELTCIHSVPEDEPHQYEQDHLAQRILKIALYKADTAYTFLLWSAQVLIFCRYSCSVVLLPGEVSQDFTSSIFLLNDSVVEPASAVVCYNNGLTNTFTFLLNTW